MGLPQAVKWDVHIFKQDLFPKQSSHLDLIVSSRFLIHLCQLVVVTCGHSSCPPRRVLCSLQDFLQQFCAPPLSPQATFESCIICIAFSKAYSVILLENVIPYTFIYASCINHIISVFFLQESYPDTNASQRATRLIITCAYPDVLNQKGIV